jgi:glycosyltransferase involved in cell wall biosynthesis
VSEPVTIMHLIDTAGPGGAETVFAQLASELGKRGTRSLTVVPREDWLTSRLREMALEPVLLDARGSMNVKYLRALLALGRREKVRLIHTHLLGSAVYGALLGMLLRCPVLAVIHGPTDLKGVGSFAGVKRWLLRKRCSAIVAVSTSTRAALIDFGIPEDAIHLIPNGVDTELYVPGDAHDLRDELGIGPHQPLFGAVGNIRKPKAYEVLLNAAARVVERLPDARFVVVGQGDGAQLEALRDLHRSLGLGERFVFAGFRRNVPALFHNFDAFVSSSRSEGLSLSFLEAMAAGRAIVATRSGGPQEVLEDRVSGILVPTDDPEALAASLCEVATDRNLKTSLGVRARERVVRDFSLASMSANYRALYKSLIGI